MTTLSIQQMAATCGLSAHTLRYYEDIGLLDPVSRAANGHRRYSAADRRWIDFLLRLRSTGMPISQMQDYAALRRSGNNLDSVAARQHMLEQHVLVLETRLVALQDNLALMRGKVATYAALAVTLQPADTEAEHETHSTLSTGLEPPAPG